MSQSVFEINYQRHTGQQEVISELVRRKKEWDIATIVCSRGWGKTLFGTCDILVPTMLSLKNSQSMWVAPTYKHCGAMFDDVWKGIDENTGKRFIPDTCENTGIKFFEHKKGVYELHLFNGSKVFARSTQNPDNIVAKGFNLIIIDEASLINKDIFYHQILGTARRKGIKIIIITTPRGKNWVYELYLAGQEKGNGTYISFRQPWWKRPDYPEFLKKIMLDIPEHIRKQEFEAEFIDDGSGAFTNFSNIFKGDSIDFPGQNQHWERPLSQKELDEETFVLSVDFAKSVDYTVIVGMTQNTRRMFYYKRFNKMDYKLVLEDLRRIAKKYEADIIFDATGVGAGLQDFLSGDFNVHPFKFTNESKNEIINKMILAFQYVEIELPNITTMRNEFELFTYTMSKTGKILYSAPDGKHDDTVIAVAMANWYCLENAGAGQVRAVEDYFSVINDIYSPRSKLQQLMDEDD
ncbi:MAG: terminase family protein [Bacteroidota bacterium]|nr:terminase family protein [Bacteroidota bacterium]